VGGGVADRQFCDKVVQRAIELMYQPKKGQFIYQKTRWVTNRINYTRWSQAWAYYALAFYNRQVVGGQMQDRVDGVSPARQAPTGKSAG
jgi:hypothetical protein